MSHLVDHVTALERCWTALGPPTRPEAAPRRAARRYPDEGGWYWVSLDDERSEPIAIPEVVHWLDLRFRLVHHLFRAFNLLAPQLRVAGSSDEPRGVEPWEWSCIGLHGLWHAWADPSRRVLADLRPALFDVDDGTPREPSLRPYELFFPRSRLEAMADALAASSLRRVRPAWQRTVGDAAARHHLGADLRPRHLLEAMRGDGLARKEGGRVVVRSPLGEDVSIAPSTFRKAARQALNRTIFERFE